MVTSTSTASRRSRTTRGADSAVARSDSGARRSDAIVSLGSAGCSGTLWAPGPRGVPLPTHSTMGSSAAVVSRKNR